MSAEVQLHMEYDVDHSDLTLDAQRLRASVAPFLQFCGSIMAAQPGRG